MHDNTYILPLFTKEIFSNFYKLKSRVLSFHLDVEEEIKKIEDYLAELQKVKAIAKKQIDRLDEEEKNDKMEDYLTKIEQYLSNSPKASKLDEIFDNVRFVSAVECNEK